MLAPLVERSGSADPTSIAALSHKSSHHWMNLDSTILIYGRLSIHLLQLGTKQVPADSKSCSQRQIKGVPIIVLKLGILLL